ncbi:endonuclease III [Candidatus Albibeggiatoa sp. nov. NOAA]|uniref:endonuclease III n=1 Tax=Candidatus Albibeggiatoa sp. nov. NOAA TaxID=3162724 RepID=UPI0032F63301|nr:endonuclease III [Thiotrichaceae bacterium]
MNKTKRQQFFARLQAENPNPTTELNYNSHFELLISVMLSAQATDKSVNKATALLYPIANTPQAILDLGEEGLKQYIKTIGLYNSKAQNVIKTCSLLLSEHGGEVPNERKALEALPGVGRKTANVILNTAFGQPTMAVDTHIFRLSNRTGLAKGKNVRQVEDQLVKNIPEQYMLDAHHWLILHGRYVCVARKPKCAICVVEDLCEYQEKEID